MSAGHISHGQTWAYDAERVRGSPSGIGLTGFVGTLRACRNDLLKSHESLNPVGSQGGPPWEQEEAVEKGDMCVGPHGCIWVQQ